MQTAPLPPELGQGCLTLTAARARPCCRTGRRSLLPRGHSRLRPLPAQLSCRCWLLLHATHATTNKAAPSSCPLVAIGFSPAAVSCALAAAGGDVQRAAAMLIDHSRHPLARSSPAQQAGAAAAPVGFTVPELPDLEAPAVGPITAAPQRQSTVGGHAGPGGNLRTSFMVTHRDYVEGYHGTTATNATHILASGFRPSRGGMLGPGVYWSDDIAKTRPYVRDGSGTVLKLKVRTGRTKTIDRAGHPSQKSWPAEGYNSAANTQPAAGWVQSGLSENCTFDPSRIEVVAVSTDYGQTFKPVEVPVSTRRLLWLVVAVALQVAFAFGSGWRRMGARPRVRRQGRDGRHHSRRNGGAAFDGVGLDTCVFVASL